MLLAVDIGNSQVSFGVFDGEALRGSWRMRTAPTRTSDEYGGFMVSMMHAVGCPPSNVGSVLAASVVPAVTRTFERVTADYFGLDARFVTAETPTGVKLDVDRPSEVGPDRIVNAVAAHHLYGGPALVVDFGTATTFDVILQGGVYAGGIILPGIQVSMDALFESAALLSRIPLRVPSSVIGRSTEACLQSGFFYGYLGQMERLIEQIRGELGLQPRVIATGGLAGTIAQASALVEIVEPHLTLKGLQIIHRRLAQQTAAE